MSIDVDVRDLVAYPGASKRHSVDEPVPGLVTELCRVPDDRSVRAELLLEGVVEGVLVSGDLSGVMLETCARCLKPFEAPFVLDVQELFSPGAAPDSPDAYGLPADGFVDLEPMIRDALLPSMPFSPLCKPDCLGLCDRCGGDRNLGECVCPPTVADARWGVLAELKLPDVFPPQRHDTG